MLVLSWSVTGVAGAFRLFPALRPGVTDPRQAEGNHVACPGQRGRCPGQGGWNGRALVYALWEAFVCVGLCTGLVYLFRGRVNSQGALARFLSHNAYAAYLIHPPVITFLTLAGRDVALYPLLKFALAALVSLPVCFGLSSLLRRIPYADRVL